MFNRCYQLVRGDEVVAEAISVWTLLDTKEMKPIRFSDTDFGMPFEDPIEISAPARFPFPRDMELVEAGRHKVRYSDIDYNQHLTNTRYPNLICDMLPSLDGKRVSEFSISFVNQAETGEDLTFLVGEADGAYYVRSLRSDGKVNIEARVKLENL
jgi:medium-chain acyl-[acyl-carrier-protein] hydrolase